MSALRRILTLMVCAAALASCQEDGPNASQTQGTIPDILSGARADCERQGGNWGLAAGKAAYVCYRQTRDANRHCTSSRDCEGMCLARSQTCSPVEPFFGCHEVLSSGGVPQTLCIE